LHPFLAYGSLALSMSLAGCYVALAKPLVAVFPVMLLAWLRFGIGALAMARWLRPSPGDVPLTPRLHRLLFLGSFLGNFLFSVCMLTGMGLTTAVSAGVIMAAIPAVVGLLGLLFLKERVDGRSAVAIAFAASGIALLAGARDTGAATPGGWAGAGVGNLLVFGAVLCEAAYAVIGKALTGSLTPRRISALINLWGLALVTPWGLRAAWDFDFGAVPWSAWVLLLFYGMAASVWTVWLWMTGLRGVPAARAGVFTVMLPISTALVGVLAMGESPDPLQGLALGVALAGVILATTPARQAAGLGEKGPQATPEGNQGRPQ
jgi:hypothetical protein